MSREFYFPLKREQLLEKPSDDRFYLEDRLFLEEDGSADDTIHSLLSDISSELNKNVLSLYESKIFSSYFTLLSSYSKLDASLRAKISENFTKNLKHFAKKLEEHSDDSAINQSGNVNIWRNNLKMYIFFTEWLCEEILNGLKFQQKEIKKGRRKIKQGVSGGSENSSVAGDEGGKKKKTKKKAKINLNLDSDDESKNDNIPTKIESVLKSINTIIATNIKVLFRNKIIEDDVITLLIKICFDSLEISIETKTLQNKDTIFSILQQLIVKFQSNTNIQLILLKLTTKIVNLIYSQEQLVSSLSEFIVLAIKGDSSLNKMAVDIIHEVSKTVFEDTNMDSQGLKNVGKFLVILSEKTAKTMYNNITSLIQLFDSESYVIRNSLVEVIANVIINILCNVDDISDVDTRNNYLKTKEKFIDILFDRIYDKNGFCRSKVLAIFEKLAENNTISVPTYMRLLTETSGRLRDEKSHVRKRAISLIGKIISMYAIIFKCDRFLNYEELQEVIAQSEKKINDMEAQIKEIESKGEGNVDNEEKTKLLEEVSKENMVIEYFQNYKNVLKTIDKVIPLISQLLGSKNISDVQESIDLFIVLHKLRISSSIFGVKKMLTLIMKPEMSIKKKVIDAYRELYFNNSKPKDMQAAYLVGLTVSLNFGEFTCLRELLKNLIQSNLIDLSIFKDIWKIMLKNPESEMAKIKASTTEELNEKIKQIEVEALSALQIINIASDYEPSILLNNADLYIRNVIANLSKKKIHWAVIQNSLIGLQKIYPLKKDITELCLLKIAKTVLMGYGKRDNNWFIITKEMIDTIFQVVNTPEKITQYFIIKLSKPFFINNENKNDEDTKAKFLTQNILSQSQTHMDLEKESGFQNNVDENGNCGINETLTPLKLAQLIFVIGQVALNMVIYSEKLEANLKKKANEKETPSKKKNESKDDINEIVGGKEAEVELNVQLLHKLIDDEILKKNLISKFIPMIKGIAEQSLKCSNKELSQNLLLYKSAILALCKLMCINQKFCEENLPFMFEILQSDTIDDSLKLNVCTAFGDFINRFPNIMQATVNKFFNCLHSKSKDVRRYSMIVISHLVLGDMLKLKGEVVDICMLLEGDDEKLKELVNLFFHEINNKGNNVIYNIIPKALAKLSGEYKNLSYEQFQNIVKVLMKYVEKDKHTEGLVEKLFVKLRNSNDVIEWRNTTYCLSLLNYNNEKIATKFIEMYSEIKDKQDEDQKVKDNLIDIFAKFKKINAISVNVKQMVETAEKKFLSGEKFVVNKEKVDTKKRVGKRTLKEMETISEEVKAEFEESEDDDDKMEIDEEEPKKAVKGKKKKTVKKKGKQAKKKNKSKRRKKDSDDEDSEEEEDEPELEDDDDDENEDD